MLQPAPAPHRRLAAPLLAVPLALLACQSPPARSGGAEPPAGSAAAPSDRAPAPSNAPPPVGAPPNIELVYHKKCGGYPQPRTIDLSATDGMMSLVDEAGEARLVNLAPARLAALADALRAASIDRLTSGPRRDKHPVACTVTLHVALDGLVKDLEDSTASEVDDPAAWQKVQAILDALWNEPH